ncbi:hypothetical protein Bhyg_06976 [Pseudolycoriella hygida]|uniref:TIL domain-containing protein n=1 Tax=Pseudolycoriella hygida TaxID=35572 RepID=A0A9Q0S3I4_9DIPT|nr:hypothetical protein Bhyg_06976 [Pseudolycoriella hygida]
MKFVLISFIIALVAASVAAQECSDPHEEYTDCIPFPECYRSCYMQNPPGCEVPECDGSGCTCQPNYVRDNHGYCIHYTHCPAVFARKFFARK